MSVDSWTEVAGAWDRNSAFVEQLKAPVTTALLAALELRAGDVVCEVGAGSGELSRVLAERVAPGGRVVATDPADGMVDVMRERLRDVPGVEVRACDAAATPLADGEAKGVVARMSLMFSSEPAAAVREAFRVLSPGGRYAAATWAGPVDNMWMAAVGMAAAMSGAAHGAGPTAPGGPFSLSEPKQLLELLEEAGFVDVDVQDVAMQVRFQDAGAHFEHVASMAGPLAVCLVRAPDEVRETVRRSVAESVARFADADGLTFPALARVVVGTRPA
jgi:SAM-dependent methyltransferase